MKVKRGRNILNIVENSPKKAHALYMLKLKHLKREKAKAEKAMRESLLAPALGGDMDSLPDDPWFGKSPEEKHADVIQEEHGQYEDGLFVGEDEGEEEGALAFIGGDISEQKFLKPDDLGFADDALGFNKPTWGKDWEGEEESTLEGSGLAAKILRGRAGQGEKFDLDPQDKMDVESSFWERTKQGRVGDAFSGLFSSDDSGRDESLAKEKKDNEELSGKIGAVAKLYSLLQPETQQAAPTIPTARITRGSVAFPGMQLASQKPRRKYFTPKGLMA